MRLFGWMQNKLSGKQDNTKKSNTNPAKSYTKQEAREEFSDWPQGLLSIGTFGNDDIKEINESQSILTKNNIQENSSSNSNNDYNEELPDIITPEEVGKLQKVLTKLLSRNKTNKDSKEMADLPLDRFLNCPSSLEVDRRISDALILRSDLDDYRDEDIDKTISAIIGRCKEVMSESKSKKNVHIGKKSISFLFKKVSVCWSGFVPAPILRDTLQESRMEKILRTMLHKSISSQTCYRSSSMKKYLEHKITTPNNEKDDDQENHDHETRDRSSTTDHHNGCKWVKTDSEYIVLEI